MTFNRNKRDAAAAACSVLFEVPPVTFGLHCELLFILKQLASFSSTLPLQAEPAEAEGAEPEQEQSADDKGQDEVSGSCIN